MPDSPHPEPMPRVLLVEDTPFLRYAFGRLLRLHGFEVLEANDGQEALSVVEEFRPDLVVTDVMMPVMDGIELIRRLHESPSTSSLPVLAITADATLQCEARARAAGAADFLPKPVDLCSLLERMRLLHPGARLELHPSLAMNSGYDSPAQGRSDQTMGLSP